MDLIRAANQDLGTTVLVVTHDPDVGSALGRTVTIRDGRVGAEGHQGEDYLVVSRDGSVQLPDEILQSSLPPGSLARAVPTAEGVELRRVDLGWIHLAASPAGGGAEMLDAHGLRYVRDSQAILAGVDVTVNPGRAWR